MASVDHLKQRKGACRIALIPPEECCAVYGGTVQFGRAIPVWPRRCVVTKRRPRMKEANLIRVRFMGPPKKNAKEENRAATPAAPASANPRLFTVLLPWGNLSRRTAAGNSERLSKC